MLFFSNLSIAFSDVIVDSLMVIQARKFPDRGAEDLNSFSWLCMSFGGFFGSIAAAILTQHSEPQLCFIFSACMGLVIAFVASRLNVALEDDGRDPSAGSGSLIDDIKRNIGDMQEALRIREFYSMILYLIIGGFLVPNFGSFGYYFMLDVVKISKFTYSMLTVLGFVCLFCGTLIYKRYFMEKEYRNLIMMDALISIMLAPLSFMFVLRLNLAWGIPDMALIVFTDVVSEIVSQCFVFLPMSVVYAKICPKRIEATSFALLASVSNLRGTVRGWLGAFINRQWVHVSVNDLSHYWVLVTISFVCSFLPLLFLWLIPTRVEIEKLQESMKEKEAESEKAALEDGSDSDDETKSRLLGRSRGGKPSEHCESYMSQSTKPSSEGATSARRRRR